MVWKQSPPQKGHAIGTPVDAPLAKMKAEPFVKEKVFYQLSGFTPIEVDVGKELRGLVSRGEPALPALHGSEKGIAGK